MAPKREIIYLTLCYHHQNDSCIQMGSSESHFNVSLIVRDRVTRPCPQTTNCDQLYNAINLCVWQDCIQLSSRVLGVLLKIVTLIGCTVVVFGYTNSFLALHIYGGPSLSAGSGKCRVLCLVCCLSNIMCAGDVLWCVGVVLLTLL